jgi:hypothetical protein
VASVRENALPAWSRARAAGSELGAQRRAAFWVLLFVVLQIGCQLALLIEALGRARVLMRSAAFGVSLVFLVFLTGAGKRHPARPFLVGILLLLTLSILHPATNTLLAGVAHYFLYAAIIAPLFWTCRLPLTEATLRRILIALWAFHTLSAAVGVLQMHYPGRFQPSVSSTIQGLGVMADAYKIRLADGDMVWRPMGLSDTPGGASTAGLYAVVFGLGFFLYARTLPLRVLSLASIGIGLFCLYIGQVRSLLVMAGICSTTMLGVLSWRGEVKKVLAVILVVPILTIGTFLWAIRVGGNDTEERLKSLVADRPDEVYGRNRGHFLTHTIVDLLPQYPLGAGLARWGMMRNYFGDETNIDSPMIWAEIQVTGWLLDGGVPLVLLYSTAVLLTCRVSWRIALSRRPGRLPLWAALQFALNIASVAVTFNYPLFIGQGGMEFWFLNGCLFMATVSADQQARRRQQARAAAGKPQRGPVPIGVADT